MIEVSWWRQVRKPRRGRLGWIQRGQSRPSIPSRHSFTDQYLALSPLKVDFQVRPVEVRQLGELNASVASTSESVSLLEPPARIHVRETGSGWTQSQSVGSSFETNPADADNDSNIAGRLRAVLLVPLEKLLPRDDSALDWPASLKDYQIFGVHALMVRERILLADDMGLGKTVQAIAAIRILIFRREIERTLIIVPASLVDQWRRELARWAPELRVIPIRGTAQDRSWQWRSAAHITIVSYETFRTDFSASPATSRLRDVWDLVVIDEAQKIKNRDSEVSKAVKRLVRRRSWAMTGTPMENSLDDLASLLEFVDHSAEGTSKSYSVGEAMLRRHQDLQLRRRKADVLPELPPKHVIKISIPLLPHQAEAYHRAESEGVVQLRAHGSSIRITHVLELITRLKQLCNLDPTSGESSKLEDIADRLSVLTDEGHKALIFSQYTDDEFGVGAAARYLADFEPLTFTGSMSSIERDAVIRNFKEQEHHRALILSLRAGGVGLNLQEASYVFHFDRWWNPAVERQAEDRSHRLGQNYPVTVLQYTSVGTIEERIDNVLAEKQKLFDEVVDDVSIDISSRLTQEELFGLFGLEPPGSAETSTIARRMGLELEDRCSLILEARGWNVQRTPVSRDGGIDLIAEKSDEVGFEQRLYVQCKDHARPIGVETIRELLGVVPVDGTSRPVIAAPSGLTVDAMKLATQRRVIIWNEDALTKLENQIHTSIHSE